jgi:hypothetical protein
MSTYTGVSNKWLSGHASFGKKYYYAAFLKPNWFDAKF